MIKFNQNILSTIGNTPIVKIQKLAPDNLSPIYAKLEYFNPGGSIKDRLGVYLCAQAVKEGKIKPGGTFIESTSGNTGVGIALYSTINKMNCIFVMADKQSREKVNNLKAYGARVVICPTNVEATDPRSYYSVAKKLSSLVPNSLYLNQYDNLNNTQCHYTQTGPEIWEQTEGKVDVLVVSIGTGGTICGISKYLKEKNPKIKVVAVDPLGSILAHYHRTKEIIPAQSYKLEGFGEDFIPLNFNGDLIDEFITVNDKDSFLMTRQLLSQEGIYAGGSSGSVLIGAIKYAQSIAQSNKEKKNILCIFPDSGNRYTSKIYNDDWMNTNHFEILKEKKSFDDILASVVGEGVTYE